MKTVVNPQQKCFSDFAKTIHRQFENEGTVIYKKRNEIRVFNVNGTAVNVKRFKVPHLMNRVVYTFFRKSKAQRSFEYAVKLKAMGVETPEPVAYIHTKQGGLLHYSYYISLQADSHWSMMKFGKDDMEVHMHILEAFASFTAQLHEKGIYHKDYSFANILLKEACGNICFCLVDLNRMKFGFVSPARGSVNFARISIPNPDFECIIRKYAHKRNADAEQCLKIALQAKQKFWKRYARKHPLHFE